jgi:hypothetical protein
VIEQESRNAMSGDTSPCPFERRLYELAERAKCLRDMSKVEAKRFDSLWSGSQNKILGLDGKIKYTRGLGYNCDDAACLEGSLNECHLYQTEDNWEGPYVIEKVYGGGTYQLIDHEGKRSMPPINGRYLKKYYT